MLPSVHEQPGEPLLSAEEERHLAQVIARGREAAARTDDGDARPGDADAIAEAAAARRRFLAANVGLVHSVARRIPVPAHVDRRDVVHDGFLGLDRAIEKFDWRKGFKFSTYAVWWIRQSIQRGLETSASAIRIPAQHSNDIRMALALGDGDPSSLPDRLARIRVLSELDSLDRARPVGDGTLAETLRCEADGPDDTVAARVDRERLLGLVAGLDPRSRHAVVRRFGLDDGEPATYAVIADELGVSAEAARRRVGRALDALRSGLGVAA